MRNIFTVVCAGFFAFPSLAQGTGTAGTQVVTAEAAQGPTADAMGFLRVRAIRGPGWVIEKVKNAALKFQIEHGRPARIACMGLAFKPDIDDLRESPALAVALALQGENFDVLAVEPNIEFHPELELRPLTGGVA